MYKMSQSVSLEAQYLGASKSWAQHGVFLTCIAPTKGLRPVTQPAALTAGYYSVTHSLHTHTHSGGPAQRKWHLLNLLHKMSL